MQAIKLLTGATPTCFRVRYYLSICLAQSTDEASYIDLSQPPFGDIDDRIRAISTGLGLTNILWEHDTFDSNPGPSGVVEQATVQKNYDDFIKTASNGTFSKQGAILLAHETNNLTMQLAVDNYPKLRAAFKHIVPIGVAFNKTQPYVEANFKFPNFDTYIKSELTSVQNGTSSSASAASGSSTSASAASTTQASSNNQNGMVTSVSRPTETATVTANSTGGAVQGAAASNQNGALSRFASSSALLVPALLLVFGLNF
ncbi:hypothetical protein V5O48_006308 [Marasmius crinis-equi]|uniref:chitin deacetylase n=1 Tax=Marasmius crinis-equi TaxID=585013 RepID=A0ABR3FJU2_9AGAR